MHLFSVKFLQAPHLRIRLKTEEYTHQTYTKMIQIQGNNKNTSTTDHEHFIHTESIDISCEWTCQSAIEI